MKKQLTLEKTLDGSFWLVKIDGKENERIHVGGGGKNSNDYKCQRILAQHLEEQVFPKRPELAHRAAHLAVQMVLELDCSISLKMTTRDDSTVIT